MGVVFEARQRRLDRRVAIKILRPELATAVAAERFLAEGRLLARLDHPNIVRIHDAGEADGLLYYVMEFVEGETLADRLQRGPLPRPEALRLAHDLLAALGAAHAQGVVHRDIKPANIFLRDGRALLGDFGIARWQQEHDGGLTTPGELIGTPRYMAPEQRDRTPVNLRADVYTAGLVLWEACTGDRWPAYQAPGQADWRTIPGALAGPMQRALAIVPEERWADAREMARALGDGGLRRAWPAVVAGALAVAAIGILLRWPPDAGTGSGPRGALRIAVEPFAVVTPGTDAALADSVATSLREALEFPDFEVVPAGPGEASAAVRVRGTISVADGRIRLTGRAGGGQGMAASAVSREGARGDWDGVVQELALELARGLWERDGLDQWLPLGAFPGNQGFGGFLRAEQFMAQARYEEAYPEYVSAERADTSCYICSFRLLDLDRWLSRSHDLARVERLRRGIDRFPPHYRTLIHATLAKLPERLDTLARADESRNFYLASFLLGDELLHRGPLHGRARHEAVDPLRRTLLRRPRFGPGWEHLTWLLLSEGDRASARRALDSLLALPALRTGFSAALRVFLELGYYWRFSTLDSARQFSGTVLGSPGISAQEPAAAGARLLMTADAPRGSVEFGEMLTTAWPDRPEAATEGLLGKLYGYAALGRLDSLRVTGRRLGLVSSDVSLPLLALELEAVLRAFDPVASLRRAPSLSKALSEYLSGSYDSALRHRAAWAAGILAARSGDSTEAAAAGRMLAGGPSQLRQHLEAVALAEQGDVAGALKALPVLPPLETRGGFDGPAVDAAVRLLRAELLERDKDRASARNALIWHQHLQTIGYGTGPPQPGEIGWAVGTLARWRLARLLDVGGSAAERCAAYRAVARLWSGGEPPFRSRADSARQALQAQGCGA